MRFAENDDVERLTEYQEYYSSVVVSRDGDDLVFLSDFDDNGRSIIEESRLPVADYVAKGEGPWPWYDLGYRRAGALLVFEALGLEPPPWTEPLPAAELGLFDRARNGWASIGELLATGLDPDVVDRCGATPLWYAVRSLDHRAALVLIDAGADPGRRIELSARGERVTTILHEIVLLGRTVALDRALARGTGPSPLDSDGATPMHRLDDRSDHLNPGIVAIARRRRRRRRRRDGRRRETDRSGGATGPARHRRHDARPRRPARAGLDRAAGLVGVNVRWAGYRAKDVVRVVEVLRAGAAVVTERDRELAAEAGVPAVVEAVGA